MDEHLANVRDLMEAYIPFSVHYPTKTSWVITIEGQLNPSQLRVLVDLGASMGPNRSFMITGRFTTQ